MNEQTEEKNKKFGPEYKHKKYLEKKEKEKNEKNEKNEKKDTSAKILDHLNNILALYSEWQNNNKHLDLVMKIVNKKCLEAKQMLTVGKFVDDVESDIETSTQYFDNVVNKINNENTNNTKEIEIMLENLSNKRKKLNAKSFVYIFLCENNVLFINITEKNVEEEFSNYLEKKEKSVCTIISPVKKLLGSFKGNDNDAKLMAKYLINKYKSFGVIYGKNGKLNEFANDLNNEEIFKTFFPIEKKKPEAIEKKKPEATESKKNKKLKD